MTQRSCCVPGYLVKLGDGVLLHQFPNPSNPAQIERFRTWVVKIGGNIVQVDNGYIYRNRKVCHRHIQEEYIFLSMKLSALAILTLHIPDDILERVAALLGNTVDGLPAYYGGDYTLEVKTPTYSTSSTGDSGSCSTDAVVLDSATVTATDSSENEVLAKIVVKDNCITELPIKRMKANEPISTPQVPKKKLKSDENRAARNKAMVEYYTKKSKLIEAYYENILLENKKLKLELERMQKEDSEPPS